MRASAQRRSPPSAAEPAAQSGEQTLGVVQRGAVIADPHRLGRKVGADVVDAQIQVTGHADRIVDGPGLQPVSAAACIGDRAGVELQVVEAEHVEIGSPGRAR
ncbi:hypothetical protein EGK76_14590 [Luteimonas sp. 100069]|nr:hypothetical protein EGK76_14590 [Luteimonas sp. 100069]